MKRSWGFSLTELLVAVALLAVLAAVVAPMAIQSKARADVARARAEIRKTMMAMRSYMLDWNTVPCDNNDYVTPAWRKGLYFSKESPGVTPDVVFLNNDYHSMERFYTKAPFVPLTTPVAYRASIPLDPFSSVVPLGYDTRELNPTSGRYAYCTLLAAGPDRTEGNWYRGTPWQGGMSRAYDPSNGALSPGDMIVTLPLDDAKIMGLEYPFTSTF